MLSSRLMTPNSIILYAATRYVMKSRRGVNYDANRSAIPVLRHQKFEGKDCKLSVQQLPRNQQAKDMG